MDTKAFVTYKEKIIKECSKVIVGKEDVIEKVLICYLCGGHILLEDVPGTGKTMLLRTFFKGCGRFVQKNTVHSRYTSLRFDWNSFLQSKERRV